jgi:hypothetical protein
MAAHRRVVLDHHQRHDAAARADVVIQRGRDLAADRWRLHPSTLAYRYRRLRGGRHRRRVGLFELAAEKPFEATRFSPTRIEGFPTGVMGCAKSRFDPETGAVSHRSACSRRVDAGRGRQSAACSIGQMHGRHRAWPGLMPSMEESALPTR